MSRRVRSMRRLALVVAAMAAFAAGGSVLSGFSVAPDVVVLRSRPKDAPELPVQFSHVTHDSINCHQCHPGLYSTPPQRMSHRLMDAGRSCGACHDGRRTTAVGELRCDQCHVK